MAGFPVLAEGSRSDRHPAVHLRLLPRPSRGGADARSGTTSVKLTIPARAVRVFSSALLRQKHGTLARTRIREARDAVRRIRNDPEQL